MTHQDRDARLRDLDSGLEEVPFPLFGLPEGMLTPCRLGSTGHSGDVVNLVAIEHGQRDGGAWVQVTVTGPTHHGSAVRDPLPMIATEYLNLLGIEVATAEELDEAVKSVLASSFTEAPIEVDGQVETFRTLSQGTSWVAVHDLPPDHVLYVLGRGFPIADLRLERLTELRRYVVPSSA